MTFKNGDTQSCHVRIVPAVSLCHQHGPQRLYLKSACFFLQLCEGEEGPSPRPSIALPTPQALGSGGYSVLQLVSSRKAFHTCIYIDKSVGDKHPPAGN